tara:strand:+ start:79 stop:567 length:489 start_codon:yes stop_codon:yes gene_type:complete
MEINDYPNYLIYEDGRVWSKTSNKFLKPNICASTGYYKVFLYNNKKRKFLLIHRLIALHYIPNPNNKPEVDHINRIRTDNRIENLRWVNRSEQSLNRILPPSNTSHKYICKIKKTGKDYYVYQISKKKYFKKILNCKKHTLQDAINLRDELLIEYNIVEPSV